MNKQKALELFEAWWDSYDLHEASRIARIDNKWPAVILDEGDNDWQQGLYVGWMNAMKARADFAAERERKSAGLIRALIWFTGVTAGTDPAGALIARAEEHLAKLKAEANDG